MILLEFVIPSDRGPQPAAFAGWGGEARDLQFAEYQTNRAPTRRYRGIGNRRGRFGAAHRAHAAVGHCLVWTGVQHLLDYYSGSAAGSNHGGAFDMRHVRK